MMRLNRYFRLFRAVPHSLSVPVFMLLWVSCGSQAQNINGHVYHGHHHHHGQEGELHGGQQPVSGSFVYLFAVSTNGYGSASSSILHGAGVQYDGSGNGYVVSDSGGGFNLSGLWASNCPSPNSYLYLQALGGDPGTGSNNTAINLVSALGSCASLLNATSVAINELTTVAAAWELLPYANVSNGSFATSGSNLQGLASAFTYANNLVSSAYGNVLETTPDGIYPVPYVTINSVASILAECVNSTPTSSACTGLFSLATPPGGSAPVDTLQAALDIAQNPTQNVAALDYLIPPTSQFEPVLASPPSSWAFGYGAPSVTTLTTPYPAGSGYSFTPIVVHVDCNAACGNVDFRINGSEWIVVALNSSGDATPWLSGLSAGQYVFQAYYLGNNAFQQSNSGPVTLQVTTPTTPTVTTVVPLYPVDAGTYVKVNVHVNCNSSCGMVDYTVDGSDWGTVQLDINGDFSAPRVFNTAGQHSFQVYYRGDGVYQPSDSGPIPLQVLATPTSTTAILSGSTVIQSGGLAPTIKAQVSCNSACGYVDYRVDGGEWTTVALASDGSFTETINSGWSVGLHSVVVNYQGNGTYLPSASDAVSFSIVSANPAQTTIYSYNITSYAPNGNVLAYTDLVNGTWSNIGYDGLNRLTGATQAPVSGTGSGQAQNFCWGYDSFGNRTSAVTSNMGIVLSGNYCVPQSTSSANWTGQNTIYTASNQIAYAASADPNLNLQSLGTPVMYDPLGSGNVVADNVNGGTEHMYLYDAENRICAEGISLGGGQPPSVGVQYLYDAEGRRVAKGNISSWNCDLSSNGFTETNGYVFGTSGEQESETDSAGNWLHTNVYAGGQMIATYDAKGLHFQLSDWLGSRRVQTDFAGNIEETCTNLPFGEQPPCTQSLLSTADDATEQHFTGKERDTESGLDYFGARYFASNMGRWMSPDWADKPEAVPYSSLDNPQTLNLYGYVGNNPLSHADANGHCLEDVCIGEGAVAAVAFVGLTASAYLAMPSTQRSLSAAASSAGATISSTFHNIFSKSASATAAAATTNPGKPGTKGKPDHQATAAEEAAKIGGTTEVKIPTPGGAKDSRRGDAVATDPVTGVVTAVTQIIRPTPAGNVPKREQDAARDIENSTGVKPKLVPVRPLLLQ